MKKDILLIIGTRSIGLPIARRQDNGQTRLLTDMNAATLEAATRGELGTGRDVV